jgi:Flp pilus assembly protein TadB
VDIVETVKLDVYLSCSFREKREVLDAFWRTKVNPSERINQAAVQYGPWAIICIAIVVLELAVLIALLGAHGSPWVWAAGLVEAAVILSLWWAMVRYRALKGHFAT